MPPLRMIGRRHCNPYGGMPKAIGRLPTTLPKNCTPQWEVGFMPICTAKKGTIGMLGIGIAKQENPFQNQPWNRSFKSWCWSICSKNWKNNMVPKASCIKNGAPSIHKTYPSIVPQYWV